MYVVVVTFAYVYLKDILLPSIVLLTMADLSRDQIEEIFRLFDSEGEGIKIKDIGTIIRSLGLNPSSTVLDEIIQDAKAADGEFGRGTCSFSVFLEFVERAKASNKIGEAGAAADLDGLKDGMVHYYDKVFPSKAKLSGYKNISVKELLRLTRTMGDSFTEEEIEDFQKELKAQCIVENGRIDFADLKKMVMAS